MLVVVMLLSNVRSDLYSHNQAPRFTDHWLQCQEANSTNDITACVEINRIILNPLKETVIRMWSPYKISNDTFTHILIYQIPFPWLLHWHLHIYKMHWHFWVCKCLSTTLFVSLHWLPAAAHVSFKADELTAIAISSTHFCNVVFPPKSVVIE